MIIETVKVQGEGFLINGVTFTDNPEHRFYQAVLEWEKNGGTIDPEFTQVELDAQAATQYQRDRLEAYPDIGEQLDMIFHDKQNGTTNWQDMIYDIKTAFPK